MPGGGGDGVGGLKDGDAIRKCSSSPHRTYPLCITNIYYTHFLNRDLNHGTYILPAEVRQDDVALP